MLRMYFLQQWFNLSDPGMEEVLYDSVVMRDFVGIGAWGGSRCRTRRTYAEVPSSAGRTWAGRGDAGDGEPTPVGKRGADHHRNDRRRDHHFCAELDQKIGNRSATPEMRQTKATSGTSG